MNQRPRQFFREADLIKIERDLAISLASTDDLAKGLHLCLEACLLVSGLDCGGVYLFDDMAETLNLVAHSGLSPDFVESVSTYANDSQNVSLVKKGMPIYTCVSDLDPSLLTEVEREENLRAFATIPIFDKSNVIGCINIASHFLDEIDNSSRLAAENIAIQAGSSIGYLKIQKALKESEEHLRSLMLTAEKFAVYRLNHCNRTPGRLKVVFVSPSIVDIMGVDDPKDFERWFDNIHADDRERIMAANAKAFQTSRFDEEMKIYHPKRKQLRWVHAISKGIHNEHGSLQYVNGIMLDITKRKLAEKALALKKKELKNKTIKLESINTALNVLIKQREDERTLRQEQIVSNIKRVILPYLDMLKKDIYNENKNLLVDTLESNLNEIISDFSLKLSSEKYGLTDRELLVADLIRQGKKTREIAKLHQIAPKTVEVHRDNIRKKLGLRGKKINLQSYLRYFNKGNSRPTP